MLRSLSIRDFLLIDSITLEFHAGFSALTGETGAGKSILIDALGLVLGARAETAIVRSGAARAEITAEFEPAPSSSAAQWLAANDMQDADEARLVVRRVLDSAGKSRAYINGSPVTLAELRALGELLIDVHAQHEHQALVRQATQRDLLDAFAQSGDERSEVAACWRAWTEAKARRDHAAQASDSIARERESLEHSLVELRALKPSADEWQKLSAEHARINNAQTLQAAALGAFDAIANDEGGALSQLAAAQAALDEAAKLDLSLITPRELIESARIQLDEAQHTLRQYQERFEIDPARAADIESRISALFHAARRARIQPDGLEALLAEQEGRFSALAQAADLDALAAACATALSTLRQRAAALSKKRESAARKLAKTVNAMLSTLALPDARFGVSVQPLLEPTAHGGDDIGFTLQSHPSLPAASLAKAASGGELARVSLAVRVALGAAGAVPTLVFDEIDVGIGGSVAAVVGQHLQRLAGERQVLVVTHQAQVAAHAHAHWVARKSTAGLHAKSDVVLLTDAERALELARMLSGQTLTESARAHARELLLSAQAQSV